MPKSSVLASSSTGQSTKGHSQFVDLAQEALVLQPLTLTANSVLTAAFPAAGIRSRGKMMSQPPFDPNLVVSPQSLDLSAMTNMPANLPLLLQLQQQQQQLLLACQDQLQQKRLQRLAETIASVTAPEQRIAFIQQQLAQQMALLQQKLTEVTQLLAAKQPQQGLPSDRQDG